MRRQAISLTSRETEVLHLVALGYTNPQIASALVVTPHTVKAHIEHLLAKLRARNRTEAVILALQSGLIPPTTPGEPRQ